LQDERDPLHARARPRNHERNTAGDRREPGNRR
jgi:hypothetical protein